MRIYLPNVLCCNRFGHTTKNCQLTKVSKKQVKSRPFKQVYKRVLKNNKDVQSSLSVDTHDNVEKTHTDVHCVKELASVEEHLQCADIAKNPSIENLVIKPSLRNSEAVTKPTLLFLRINFLCFLMRKIRSEFDSDDSGDYMNKLENPKSSNAMESAAGAQILVDLSQNMSLKVNIPGPLVRHSHDMEPTNAK